jgi:hypothetical protein
MNVPKRTPRGGAGLSPIWGSRPKGIGGMSAVAGSYAALPAPIAIQIVGETSLFVVRNPWDNTQACKGFVANAAV